MTSQSTVLVFDFLNTSIREFFLIFVFTLGKTIRISQFYFEQIQFNSNRITKGPLENSMNMELSGNRRIVESYLNSQPSISQSVSQSCSTLRPHELHAAGQASLCITNFWSSLKLMSVESAMPSSHLILCRSLLLLPPIRPSIRVFSNESTLRIRWPKYWSFSFSISPSSEHPGLISFRMDWVDLFAV